MLLLTRFSPVRKTFFRLKSTNEKNFIEQINRIKPKDLSQLFDEQQIKRFFQIKRAVGGKFYSLEQLKNEPDIQIDCKPMSFERAFFFPLWDILVEQVIGQLSAAEKQRNRIQIEPRLTSKTVAVKRFSIFSLDRRNDVGFI